jgi:HEAT repeat protein
VLYDADGIDSYACKSRVNVNGYGNYRREFGSLGLQVDMLGGDYYAARGRNDAVWESGMYGLGIDYPGEPTRPRGDLAQKIHPFEKRAFTPEELFILSARGEPRFNRWRKYAFDKMVKDPASTIEYLRSVLDTRDARERHTIKDILKEIGEPAVPMLSAAVMEDGRRARAEASWILGIIGSPAAFDPLLELSRDDNWKLRSSALNAIGKLKDLSGEDRKRLEVRVKEVATDTDEVFIVKKDAMYAAGKQKLCGTLDYMLETLEHGHYSARFAAAEAVRDISAGSCDGVGDMLLERVPEMSSVGVVAGLHAAHDLPSGIKLDIAGEALRRGDIDDVHVGLAVARLLETVEPENKAQERRLDDARARVSELSWQAASMLE